jgi:hypothetical protein
MRNSILLSTLVLAAAVSPVVAQPQSTNSDKLDAISTSLDAVQQKVDKMQDGRIIRDIGPTAVGIFSLIVTAFISVKALNRNSQLTRRSIEEKGHEEERKSIREKLDQFYGPFMQLREVSKHLYEVFTARIPNDVKAKYKDGDGRYRTLIALTRGYAFDGMPKALLEEIVKIGADSEKLILEKVGLVDDPALQKLLGRATAHYRILRLASDSGKLVGGGAEFDAYTFPYELDTQIPQKMEQLNKRLEQLRKM